MTERTATERLQMTAQAQLSDIVTKKELVDALVELAERVDELEARR